MQNLDIENMGFENLDVDKINIIENSDVIKKQVNEIISFCIKKENNLMRLNKIDEYKHMCMIKFTNFHQKYPTLFFSLIEKP